MAPSARARLDKISHVIRAARTSLGHNLYARKSYIYPYITPAYLIAMRAHGGGVY